jgi:hypothetical protein
MEPSISLQRFQIQQKMSKQEKRGNSGSKKKGEKKEWFE